MGSKRECQESPVEQSPDESLAYGVVTTPWGSGPTDVSVTVWDVTDGNSPNDVTSSVTTGSQSVVGDVITTKRIQSLNVDGRYRVDILFTDEDSNTHECYFIIYCRDS